MLATDAQWSISPAATRAASLAARAGLPFVLARAENGDAGSSSAYDCLLAGCRANGIVVREVTLHGDPLEAFSDFLGPGDLLVLGGDSWRASSHLTLPVKATRIQAPEGAAPDLVTEHAMHLLTQLPRSVWLVKPTRLSARRPHTSARTVWFPFWATASPDRPAQACHFLARSLDASATYAHLGNGGKAALNEALLRFRDMAQKYGARGRLKRVSSDKPFHTLAKMANSHDVIFLTTGIQGLALGPLLGETQAEILMARV